MCGPRGRGFGDGPTEWLLAVSWEVVGGLRASHGFKVLAALRVCAEY